MSSPAGDAAAFEAALRDNPDDLAGWCAYADWLAEQGDPRGEFMQVQLALEDDSRTKDERDRLKEREKELLLAHEKEWVGSWADVVTAPEGDDESRGQVNPTGGEKYAFHRGWITTVNIGEMLVRDARAVLNAPELRLVRNLFIGDVFYGPDAEADGYRGVPESDAPEEPDEEQSGDNPSARVLVRWPQLRYIRRFQWGWSATEDYGENNPYSCLVPGDEVFDYVKQMPNIEELYLLAHRVDTPKLFAWPMPKLRVLQIYHEHRYPLELLAANESLTKLEAILCHPRSLRGQNAYIQLEQLTAICRSPHLASLNYLRLRLTDFGDAGAAEIVNSGLLGRLKVLDLRHGCLTDEGAQMLAAAPGFKRLTFLDVSRNALTDAGISTLAATGVKFDAGFQHGQGPGYDGYDFFYLHAGDIE